MDGSAWGFTKWSDGNPDNDNRNPPATTMIQGCVATSSYLWNDLGCLSRRHFICQLDEKLETTCPSNTIHYLAHCSDQCLMNDCSGTLPSQESCLQCLETSSSSKCQVSISVRLNISITY